MITKSEQETMDFAKKFATQLEVGGCLGLVGNLGMGKTQFTKGLALGLGIKHPITSPTFVLLKEYSIKNLKSKITKFIHIDCYRLSSPEELLELGLEEYLANKNNLVVIEWADKIKTILPKDTLWINFKPNKKILNERQITLQ